MYAFTFLKLTFTFAPSPPSACEHISVCTLDNLDTHVGIIFEASDLLNETTFALESLCESHILLERGDGAISFNANTTLTSFG